MRRRQQGFLGLEGAALYALAGLAVALLLSWAGAGLALWWLDGKLAQAQERLSAAQEALGKEQQSRRGFEAAASSCSASVAALEGRARAAEAAFAAKRGESEALSRSVQAHIQAMLSRGRLPGEDECSAMRRELDDEVDYRAARRP